MNVGSPICHHPKEKRKVRITLEEKDVKAFKDEIRNKTVDKSGTMELLASFDYALCLNCGQKLLWHFTPLTHPLTP